MGNKSHAKKTQSSDENNLLSTQVMDLLMRIFRMIDTNNDRTIDSTEVAAAFQNVNSRDSQALSFFFEMDLDNDGSISMSEYIEFWTQVRQSGVSEKAVLSELK